MQHVHPPLLWKEFIFVVSFCVRWLFLTLLIRYEFRWLPLIERQSWLVSLGRMFTLLSLVGFSKHASPMMYVSVWQIHKCWRTWQLIKAWPSRRKKQKDQSFPSTFMKRVSCCVAWGIFYWCFIVMHWCVCLLGDKGSQTKGENNCPVSMVKAPLSAAGRWLTATHTRYVSCYPIRGIFCVHST